MRPEGAKEEWNTDVKTREERVPLQNQAEHVSELGHCIHQDFNSISDVCTAEGSRVEMGAVLVGREFCKVGTLQSSIAMCFALFTTIFLRYPQADNFDVRQVGWCRPMARLKYLERCAMWSYPARICQVSMTISYNMMQFFGSNGRLEQIWTKQRTGSPNCC